MAKFDAKAEAFDILDDHGLNAVILITVNEKDEVELAIQVRKDVPSTAAITVINTVHGALMSGGVANKRPI